MGALSAVFLNSSDLHALEPGNMQINPITTLGNRTLDALCWEEKKTSMHFDLHTTAAPIAAPV